MSSLLADLKNLRNGDCFSKKAGGSVLAGCIWVAVIVFSILNRSRFTVDGVLAYAPKNPWLAAFIILLLILTAGVFLKSIIQGLAVFAASFGTYYTVLAGNPDNAPLARGMGLAIIMLANLFLVQVNSSEHEYAFRSIARLATDKVMWTINIVTVGIMLLMLYTPLAGFLSMAPPSAI